MKKTTNIICIIIGILLICYPFIGKILSKINQTSVIEKYKDNIIQMDDEEKEELKDFYLSSNLSSIEEMIGYIEIPKIKVYLPIYEGTSDKVLLKGIGHLEGTQLPISSGGYHSVLVGHTGITAKTFFDDLVKLELEDEFSVTILDEVYNYKVCDIKTVLPTETDSLKQEVDNDTKIVTLVTCTPKYVNSHRLLVTGKEI